MKIYNLNISNNERYTNFLAYCAKASYTKLEIKEIKELEKYFISKSYWSLFDLYTLFYTLEQVEEETLLPLLNNLFFIQISNYKHLMVVPTYRKPLLWILVRSSLILLENNNPLFVEEVIKKVENFLGESDLTAKIILEYIRGCLCFATNSTAKGNEMIHKTLSQLEDINALKLKKILLLSFKKLKVKIS